MLQENPRRFWTGCRKCTERVDVQRRFQRRKEIGFPGALQWESKFHVLPGCSGFSLRSSINNVAFNVRMRKGAQICARCTFNMAIQ